MAGRIGRLERAAADCEISRDLAVTLFPHPPRDLVVWHSRLADRRMRAHLATLELQGVTRKIRAALQTRFIQARDQREAIRLAVRWLALPHNLPLAASLVCATSDSMWRYAGDRATDMNWYSKRGLLGAVYTSTLAVWLDDDSADLAISFAFMERRLQDALELPKLLAAPPALRQVWQCVRPPKIGRHSLRMRP